MLNTCRICGKPIEAVRLEVLPDTDRCIEHASTDKTVAYMVYPHKTGGSVMFIRNATPEQKRQARNANRRAR